MSTIENEMVNLKKYQQKFKFWYYEILKYTT